jgi:hypothetical protein
MAETLKLLFEIAADPSKAESALERFSSGMTKHLGVSSEATAKLGHDVSEAAKDLGVLGGAAAGLAAGALVLANRWAEAGTAVYEASEKTGISAEKLSGLRTTARLLDEDFSAVTVTLARMGRNIEAGLRVPSGEAGKALQALFKSSDELNKLGMMPLEQRIAEVSKRIFALNSTSQQNLELQALTGRGYMQVRSTLQELAKGGYDPLIEKAKALGEFFDEDAARRARAFRIEWQQLKVTMDGLALSLGQQLVPAMMQLVMLTEVKLQQSLGQTLLQAARDVAAGLLRITTGLATLGASELFFSERMEKLTLAVAGGKDETQAMTDSLIQLQRMVSAASKPTEELAQAEQHAAKATKEHADAVKELGAVIPPVIEEMHRLEVERARKETEAMAKLMLPEAKAPKLALPGGLPAGFPADQALEKWDAARPRLMKGINDLNTAFDSTIARLQISLPHATNFAAARLAEMGLTFQGTAERFSQAMGQGIAQAILYGHSVGEAMRMALKAAVASIAAEAIVRAIYQTAMGFAALATHHYADAALHFKSAAVFGAVGGAAAAVSAAIPGESQTSSKTAASGSTGSTSASPTSTSSSATQQPTINVYVDGVISDDKLDDVIYAINQRVTKGAVRLTSTTTIARPTVRS